MRPAMHPKYAANAPGRYYVTQACIGCNVCSLVAPDHFHMDLDLTAREDYCYVHRQPLGAREEKICEEVLRLCPTNAIGNGGSADNPGR